ncbi:YihY family inner membrane protein [Candidatus Sumerlaeota bacterium]|nr:YihY family inner membrane protein [Candidatus Sumerlaeota bacterium]
MSSPSPSSAPLLLTQRLWRTLRLTVHEFLGDRCFDKSAALAYVSLLGLFAVMTVVLSVSASVFREDSGAIEQRMENLIFSRLFPTDISTDLTPEEIELATFMGPVASTADWNRLLELEQTVQEIEEKRLAQEEVRDELMDSIITQFRVLIRQFENFRDDAVGVGAIGLLGLVLVSMMLFTQIEKGFNEVFHVRRKRTVLRAMQAYITVLVIGPILIGFSLAFSLRIEEHLEWVSPGMAGLGVTCFLFALSYWLIPNTRVSLIHALLGGAVAGTLWELAKSGFMLYVFSVDSMRNLLLHLGVIPIFLLWLFTTWVVLFIGLELCYVLQHYRPLAMRVFKPGAPLDLNPRHLLTVLFEMAQRFERGVPRTTVADLMRATNLDEYNLHELLDHCEGRGWVVAGEAHCAYHLARPPEQIALRDVLLRPVTQIEVATLGPQSPLDEFWRRYDASADRALPVKTLRDLISPVESEKDALSNAS